MEMAEKRLNELKTIEIIQTEQQRSNRLKKKNGENLNGV